MSNPVKFTKEVIKEGKRVRWPKKDVFVPTFIVVVIIAVFAACFIALEDLAAASLISQLTEAFEGI